MSGPTANALPWVLARAELREARSVAFALAAVLSTSAAFGQQPAPAAAPAVQPAPAAAPAPQPAPAPVAAPAPQPAPAVSPFTGQPGAPAAAQPPAPQPAAAPLAPAPVAAPAADQGAAEEPSKPRRIIPLSGFRVGYNAYSTGSIDFRGQCAGSCPFSLRNGSQKVTDQTRVLLGYDLMFGPEPLSVGFGFWFTTGTTLENEQEVLAERSIGWEFATPFMMGGVVSVTDDVAIRIGAYGAPVLLFADGDSAQGRDADAYESLCDDLGGQVDGCDTSFATRMTWIYGLQAGPVFRVSRLNTIGAELLLQRVDVGLFSVDADGPGWRAQQSYDYSAWRLWLMLNVGLGK